MSPNSNAFFNSPFRFKNERIAINRLVVPPMASQTATTDGFVTEKSIAHYERLSTSGAGIVFVEYTAIHPSGRSEDFQLGVWRDEHIEGLGRIAETIKRSGALAGLQIVHGGGKSLNVKLGPSAIPVPTKDGDLAVPAEMISADLPDYQAWYIQAAERAMKAGFDIIELHAAHGYGLNQWISPLTNQRSDRYGGSLQNRALMLLEIVKGIRARLSKAHQPLLLGVRLPGRDFLAGGLNSEDMVWICQNLEALGVDFIDVSSGLGGWRRPSDRSGEGYLIPEAKYLKARINLPVIGVGGIETRDYMEKVIGAGEVSFVAVGRATLRDPEALRRSAFGSLSKN